MPPLSPTDYDAIRLSLQVSVAATLLSLPFGFAVAYLITFVRFRGKVVLEVLVNLPLTLPPVVVGYFLLLLLGRQGWLGCPAQRSRHPPDLHPQGGGHRLGRGRFPPAGALARIGMEAIDPQLINASRTLGARWHDTLLTVILPLSLPGLVAGSSLMFARSLGEFGATIIVAGNIPGVTQTIPLAIYEYASSPTGETMALALCLVSVAISAGRALPARNHGKENGAEGLT